ncbi:hypothetical protein [Tychonema sp. LEGE 07203]|uniref:hypothetical protein n=1 Tax=Tychonema sp. LEGE 07203 TaxID=1828671 RepID=UPI001880042C|nr:hypothetical protein [Tychonema sp. LEGE 07203]MBE9094200.1 hypothetical protein [Tychonema sp. LEGE 07203]
MRSSLRSTPTQWMISEVLYNNYLYGVQSACYSGRGGELYQNGEWRTFPKKQIKAKFREGIIKILLCTESASEKFK